MGDRLTEIKARYRFLGQTGEDIRWLIEQVETLRQSARRAAIVIQRLRQEADHWAGVVEDMNTVRTGDEYAAENYRLAALTCTLATEAEAYKRERDKLRVKLAQATAETKR